MAAKLILLVASLAAANAGLLTGDHGLHAASWSLAGDHHHAPAISTSYIHQTHETPIHHGAPLHATIIAAPALHSGHAIHADHALHAGHALHEAALHSTAFHAAASAAAHTYHAHSAPLALHASAPALWHAPLDSHHHHW